MFFRHIARPCRQARETPAEGAVLRSPRWGSPAKGLPPSSSVVPHNREAEEAVVGAVLINPEVYYDLAQFLQADDFYILRHRWIWEAFTRLHEKRIPLDFLTVTEELESAGQLAEIGGPAYLTALLNQVPTSLHAEAYGRMVEADCHPPPHADRRQPDRHPGLQRAGVGRECHRRSPRKPSSTSASGGCKQRPAAHLARC